MAPRATPPPALARPRSRTAPPTARRRSSVPSLPAARPTPAGTTFLPGGPAPLHTGSSGSTTAAPPPPSPARHRRRPRSRALSPAAQRPAGGLPRRPANPPNAACPLPSGPPILRLRDPSRAATHTKLRRIGLIDRTSLVRRLSPELMLVDPELAER